MRYLVLGYFGLEDNQIDGQTIKTHEVFALLSKHLGENRVHYFDTQKLKGGKRFFITMLWEVLRANKIIYLPGENNLRSFYPTLSRIVKVLRKELLYIVVGGWLYEFLKMNERFVPLLKREKGVLVETKYLVDSLTLDLAFTNVEQFPNFRMQTFIPEVNYNDDKFRLVFMARIMRKKGIEYIFRFANFIKDSKRFSNIEIDFYGPILESDRDYFEDQCKQYDFVSYKGLVSPQKVYITLDGYDLLLLPSFYEGEGFPGTVVDAYIAGVPVLASRWKQIPEFVIHGKSGFLFDLDNQEAFNNHIIYLIDNREALKRMKIAARQQSCEYSSIRAWDIINKYLLS